MTTHFQCKKTPSYLLFAGKFFFLKPAIDTCNKHVAGLTIWHCYVPRLPFPRSPKGTAGSLPLEEISLKTDCVIAIFAMASVVVRLGPFGWSWVAISSCRQHQSNAHLQPSLGASIPNWEEDGLLTRLSTYPVAYISLLQFSAALGTLFSLSEWTSSSCLPPSQQKRGRESPDPLTTSPGVHLILKASHSNRVFFSTISIC